MLRTPFALVLGLAVACAALAADKRQGIDADLKAFPQATPKEALASAVKAIDEKKLDYLAAQIIDPEFIDRRLKDEALTFPQLVEQIKGKLADPAAADLMKRFLKDGTWDETEGRAVVHLKDVADRAVSLKQSGGRWFIENRYQPEVKR